MNDTLSAEFHPTGEDLAALQKLTRDYAKFSRDAAGLGHVFGGLLVFLLVLLLRSGSVRLWEGILLGATPFIWIFIKEWLHTSYYQFAGFVTQPPRRWHDLIVGILAAFTTATIVVILLTYRFAQPFTWTLALRTTLCLGLLLVMPFLAWRYLRAPYEFVTGIFLLVLAAFLLSGNLGLAVRFSRALDVVAGLVALVMIPAGYAEHMEFLKLRRKMQALKEPA